MSTGSVVPFTPNQPTQNALPSVTANSLFSINSCDSVLIYNGNASAVILVAFATETNLYTATPLITTGVPVGPGQSILLGISGVGGFASDPIVQVAFVGIGTVGAGNAYISPGLGTQH